jgi:hypothetical protein
VTATFTDAAVGDAGWLGDPEGRDVDVAGGAAACVAPPLQPDSNVPAATSAAACTHLTW